ncbi:MAG: hypothetical protein ABEJ04_07355 [Halobacteriaceae archaeon]
MTPNTNGSGGLPRVPVVDGGCVASIGVDTMFELLSHRLRRYALYALTEGSADAADLDELVDFVVAHSSGSRAQDRERVAVTLYHEHLPKLEDVGVVEYDERSETARYRGPPLLTREVEFARKLELDE